MGAGPYRFDCLKSRILLVKNCRVTRNLRSARIMFNMNRENENLWIFQNLNKASVVITLLMVGILITPCVGRAQATEFDASGGSVFPVSQTKAKAYLQEGVFVGGDQRVSEYAVTQIRRAPNAGFERIVFDFDTFDSGQVSALSRAPYYQVSVEPEHNRVTVALFGNVRVKVDGQATKKSFQNSPSVKSVDLFSRVLDDAWVMSFQMQKAYPIEVIELQNPIRVVLDVKQRKD